MELWIGKTIFKEVWIIKLMIHFVFISTRILLILRELYKKFIKVLQKVANIKLRDFIKIHYTSILKDQKY
ncbi:hypothetical protein DMI77_08810 [Akkermansia muciniphila]|nr:hypothetical protein DMI77_08810 [Akkermansia muciniphila]